MQKNIIGLKKVMIKIIKKRKVKKNWMKKEKGEKKRKFPQNCKSPMQRQRFITTIKGVTEYTHKHIQP